MPLISVILPCYNASSTIGDAILSIIRQTFTNWELIVVDDASTDNSVTVIKSFTDPRIRLISQSVNGGYPVAMNVGIASASGKYIARMDADDVSAPTRLEEQLKALEQCTTAALCGTYRYKITPGQITYIDKIEQNSELKEETWSDLMRGMRHFTDASVMVKREYVQAVGGYRTFQRSGMDVDLWLRIMERFGHTITILRPLYGRRLDLSSLVFNPRTSLLNQIPRVLASQRKERGSDDVQDNRICSLEMFLEKGLIKKTSTSEDELVVGAIATCLRLHDYRGAWLYFASFSKSRKPPIDYKVKFILRVCSRFLTRLRHNPHRKIVLN